MCKRPKNLEVHMSAHTQETSVGMALKLTQVRM